MVPLKRAEASRTNKNITKRFTNYKWGNTLAQASSKKTPFFVKRCLKSFSESVLCNHTFNMSQLLRQVFLSETLSACDSNLESFFILLQNVLLETAVILLEQEFEGNGAGVGSMTDKLAKVRILELKSLILN